jgi:predicted  nucleic acid-binding Zn-ribbon protein
MDLKTDALDRLEEIASRMESTLDGLKAIHADVDGQMKAEEEIREETEVELREDIEAEIREDMEDELQQAEELAEQYKAERDRLWIRLETLEDNILGGEVPAWFSDYQRDLVPPTDK